MAKNLEADLDLHGVARILNLPTPTDDYDASNKLYVDTILVLAIVNSAARLIKTQRVMAGIVLRGQT